MPRFSQTVNGQAEIYVDAEDQYEADNMISSMNTQDILELAESIDFYPSETDEFPQEV